MKFISIVVAQKNVWPTCSRATCFFHLMKNQKDKLKKGRLRIYWPEIKKELHTLAKVFTFSSYFTYNFYELGMQSLGI
jgi:hypothetical protein